MMMMMMMMIHTYIHKLYLSVKVFSKKLIVDTINQLNEYNIGLNKVHIEILKIYS